MAEERTLGLARASERVGEEESKEELQRRLELARDSISHTVTEIKETVAHQVQAVKDTLDWREQFKKRPVAWSAGAMGAGFLAGYSIAGAFKSERYDAQAYRLNYGSAPQKSRMEASMAPAASFASEEIRDDGPGLVERFKESSAYESLSKEVSSLGNKVVEELSSAAHLIVLPFLLGKLKEWVRLDRLEKKVPPSSSQSVKPRTDWTEPDRTPRHESTLGHS